MCGRNALFAPQPDLEARFDAEVVADGGYTPRYNIAPGEPLEIITNEEPAAIERFHWGLIPPWMDEPADGFINARSETADENRAVRDAWTSRPCLVLSSGFYEWQSRTGGGKQPYRILRTDEPAFAMAGLWETWTGDGGPIDCVTILTTEPNDLVAPIHDRMPVVLTADDEEVWLEGTTTERNRLCRPYPEDDLDAYEISTRVNDPNADDPRVVEPLEHEQSDLDEF